MKTRPCASFMFFRIPSCVPSLRSIGMDTSLRPGSWARWARLDPGFHRCVQCPVHRLQERLGWPRAYPEPRDYESQTCVHTYARGRGCQFHDPSVVRVPAGKAQRKRHERTPWARATFHQPTPALYRSPSFISQQGENWAARAQQNDHRARHLVASFKDRFSSAQPETGRSPSRRLCFHLKNC